MNRFLSNSDQYLIIFFSFSHGNLIYFWCESQLKTGKCKKDILHKPSYPLFYIASLRFFLFQFSSYQISIRFPSDTCHFSVIFWWEIGCCWELNSRFPDLKAHALVTCPLAYKYIINKFGKKWHLNPNFSLSSDQFLVSFWSEPCQKLV